jgi:hypothetical protein
MSLELRNMRKTGYVVAVKFLWLLLLLPGILFALEYDPCPDTVYPCDEPALKIRINTEDGQSIYEYDSKLSQHTPISWDDPQLDRYTRQIVSKILKNVAESEKLPDPTTGQHIEISDRGYTLFKKRTGPTSTFYEGRITLKYDEKTETAKIIVEAGF